jgi:hypothetical protein
MTAHDIDCQSWKVSVRSLTQAELDLLKADAIDAKKQDAEHQQSSVRRDNSMTKVANKLGMTIEEVRELFSR